MGNPYDGGRRTVTTRTSAEYEGGPGVIVTLTRTEATEPPFGCD
jgi:hypothetical protein